MHDVWPALPGLLLWTIILILPWRPWSTRENLRVSSTSSADLSSITVLIPARNEASHIATTLSSLSIQGNIRSIILIDDCSTDDTASIAAGLGLPNLEILTGEPLAPGWSGKLWALEQGRIRVESSSILLLDADIELLPGTLATLQQKSQHQDLQLVSLMANLRMKSAWEKLLMPAFIYFFKLLYPFALSNRAGTPVAAAAGGCILLQRSTLDTLGGFAALKDALIDDCTLARKVKNIGGSTWVGLSHDAVSHREYPDLASIWDMVARTAYTQLHYSPLLLLACTILMLVAFILPLVVLFVSGLQMSGLLALLTFVLMAGSYLPVIRYYGLPPVRTVTLPFVSAIYLMMTWSSAIRHWRGKGTSWKERVYSQ